MGVGVRRAILLPRDDKDETQNSINVPTFFIYFQLLFSFTNFTKIATKLNKLLLPPVVSRFFGDFTF